MQTTRKPRPVILATILQMLVALAFLSVPILGLVYGSASQAAAEAELTRQGVSPAVLTEFGIAFDESGIATLVPAAVALILVTLALRNLVGSRTSRVLTWFFLPLVLVGNYLIMASNAAAVQTLQSVFKDHPTARNINVQALLDASGGAYPTWVPFLQDARFVVVTAGSLLIIVLLALRSASFRKTA